MAIISYRVTRRGGYLTEEYTTWLQLQIYLFPNVEVFFVSTMSVFSRCTPCLELHDGDQGKLLLRRLEGYKETLRAMYQRINETRPHQEALEHDTEYVAFEGRKRSLSETTAKRRALTEQ